MKVRNVRHKRHEIKGFSISRPNGLDEYVFLHFYNPITMHTKDGDVMLKNNACIIYNVGTPQTWISEEELCHDWMHIDKSFADLINKYGIQTDTVIYPSDVHAVSSIMTEIEYEYFNSFENGNRLTELLLEQLCIKLKRSYDGTDTDSTCNLKLLDQFANLRIRIHSTPDNCWTVEKMAEEVKFSVSGFHRTYKALFSVSPTEDLINAKIDSAKYYLSSTELSISEISQKLGYANTTHFCRQFKDRAGVTASEYRNNSHKSNSIS